MSSGNAGLERRRFLPFPLASGCPEAGLSTVQGPETSPPTNPMARYHDGISDRFGPVSGLVPVGSDPRGGVLSDLMSRYRDGAQCHAVYDRTKVVVTESVRKPAGRGGGSGLGTKPAAHGAQSPATWTGLGAKHAGRSGNFVSELMLDIVTLTGSSGWVLPSLHRIQRHDVMTHYVTSWSRLTPISFRWTGRPTKRRVRLYGGYRDID